MAEAQMFDLITSATMIANDSLTQKADVLSQIAGQMGMDTIQVDLSPSQQNVDISSVGGVVLFQEWLQKLANVIEETGQTLGLSDKEVKEIKQMLGMV